MYKFSFVETVGGKAVVVDRKLFHEIISREKVKNICAQIAEQERRLETATDGAQKKAIQDYIGKLKRGLPAFCWHAWFEDGQRKNDKAHASGLIMMDLDHVEKPRELFEEVKSEERRVNNSVYIKGHRLLAAHVTPSTKGLRLVFAVPERCWGGGCTATKQGCEAGGHGYEAGGRSCEVDIVKAQTMIVNDLGLKNVDACTKDLARLSFCVPESYWLYVDEEALFGPTPALQAPFGPTPALQAPPPVKGRGIDSNAAEKVKGDSSAAESVEGESADESVNGDSNAEEKVEGDNSAAEKEKGDNSAEEKVEGDNSAEEKVKGDSNAEAGAVVAGSATPTVSYPAYYGSDVTNSTSLITGGGQGGGSIPYKLIVECLQELLGGVPAHGSRNNFIFSMAAYLRYVCNDDPEWIASVLPTYGEATEKWKRTIQSACQRAQYRQMPQIVRRAIAQAKSKVDSGKSNVDSTEDMPPEMPKKLPKVIAHLVKNVPEVCRPAVANAVFPALAAHLKGVKFWLIDGTEKEATFMCVTMAKQSSGKSAVNKPIEYITADIVERDELSRKREQDWKDAMASKGANKEKPKRPDDLCVQVLVSDMTNAAFVQRMKDANGRYLYTNLEELDLLKQLQTNGTKDVGKIICLCFDNGKYGQERVGTSSVTARVDLRWNWNASSTIQKGMKFFAGRLVDGTLSRVNFCTIIPDKSKKFVYGRYDEKYAEVLKPYITNLNLANGNIECKQALDLARKLQEKCAEEGALTDDDVYQDLAYRAVTIAYLKAMVLYICNDMTWSKDIAEFAEWSLNYDLWCKCHFFGAEITEEKAKENVKARKPKANLLDMLPEAFTLGDAADVRRQNGMKEDGTKQMLATWKNRGYIEYDMSASRYVKTEEYLNRVAKIEN